MADDMTAPRPAPSDHRAHDLLGVAEAADRGGRLPADLAACPDCVALHADLVALATALPAAATPVRSRDYTLSPADAARLRPHGWRRLLRGIGSPADVFTRPLAIGLTTLGLAGLLVATVPGALPGSGGAAVTGESGGAGSGQLEAPAAAPSAQPMTMSTAPEAAASPAAEATDDDVFTGIDTGDPEASPTGDAAARADPSPPVGEAAVRDDASGLSTLIVVAGALLIAGLGLFGLRWSAGRQG